MHSRAPSRAMLRERENQRHEIRVSTGRPYLLQWICHVASLCPLHTLSKRDHQHTRSTRKCPRTSTLKDRGVSGTVHQPPGSRSHWGMPFFHLEPQPCQGGLCVRKEVFPHPSNSNVLVRPLASALWTGQARSIRRTATPAYHGARRMWRCDAPYVTVRVAGEELVCLPGHESSVTPQRRKLLKVALLPSLQPAMNVRGSFWQGFDT